MIQIGIGYRRELAPFIEAHAAQIDCLEITAEHFFKGGQHLLLPLADRYPVYVHGLALSLGTPGPLDRHHLQQFAHVAKLARAQAVSDHIAFTRAAGVNLGHLNPVPPTRASLQVIADHAREVADHCGLPLLLENITSHLPLHGDLSEPDFLNALCDQAGCHLLLDITNLYINSRNHPFDPLAWLHQLNPHHLRQLHIVGFAHDGARFTDSHADPIQTELLDLTREVLKHAPIQSIILERDQQFTPLETITQEIAKLATLRTHH